MALSLIVDENYIREFRDFLETNSIFHFSPHEILNYNIATNLLKRKKFSINTFPPRELWEGCLPTLKIMEKARAEIGRGMAIYVNSFWRSPEYNAAVGGSSRSFHKQFKAGDFSPSGCTPFQLYEYLNNKLDSRGWGIALYVNKNFVHLDCRGVNGDTSRAYREIRRD